MFSSASNAIANNKQTDSLLFVVYKKKIRDQLLYRSTHRANWRTTLLISTSQTQHTKSTVAHCLKWSWVIAFECLLTLDCLKRFFLNFLFGMYIFQYWTFFLLELILLLFSHLFAHRLPVPHPSHVCKEVDHRCGHVRTPHVLRGPVVLECPTHGSFGQLRRWRSFKNIATL